MTRPPVSNNAADDWLEMSDDDDDEGLDEEKKSSEQECDECSGGDCSDEDEPSAGQARP